MTISRLRCWLLFFVSATFFLGNCTKKDDSKPLAAAITAQQLTTGSWRLDEIVQNGQVTSSGAGIKDQYSLTFRTDGTYTQKLLADNATFNGMWMLMSDGTVLHFIDHKGDVFEYTIANVAPTAFRYHFTNKNNQREERGFTAQP